ncbi:MAG: alpha-galactosidase, partial [Treponema sp.]|nr:alpha-galactosidase [Treponema sp.]
MLYYSPQIWCSDDTDAIERLEIQEGTALIYPLSAIGSHVSVCPNHTCGRVTPFKTRGYVAMSGTFGYELDITKLSEDEKNMIPHQIELYKKYNDLVRNGDYFRIASYSINNEFDCWASISKDKKKAIITFVQVLNHPNYKSRFIKLFGLDENKLYEISYPDEQYNQTANEILSGKTLMNAGLCIKRPWGDFESKLIYL